jgi:GntR family transcriptional regulator, arabinose operon transcriptional repressor
MSELGFAPKHILIADKIRDYILSGKIKTGERLQADTELAKGFKVNKKTVANGLALLVGEGLISRAPGRGSVVTHKNDDKYIGAVGLIMLSRGHVNENISEIITRALVELNMYPVLFNHDIFVSAIAAANKQILPNMVKNMLKDNPFGLIVDGDESVPFDILRRSIKQLKSLVFINHYQNDTRIDEAKYVLVDYVEGGRRQAWYFINRGHRELTFFAVKERTKIGYLGSPQQQMMKGFKEVCKSENISFNRQIPGQLMAGDDLTTVLQRHMEKGKLPTGVGSSYDSHACRNILPALKELNLSVPNDISIIGFFNTPWSEKSVPPLTSLSINEPFMAKKAVGMLTGETDEKEMVIYPNIIERQSVKNYNL